MKPRESPEYRDVLARGVEDIDDVVATFNALLNVAQVEAGQHRGEWSWMSLGALLEDLMQLYLPVAEESRQHLTYAAFSPGFVDGDRQMLGQALSNLIDNALKFTPEGGTIEVELRETSQSIVFSISDSGPGIPLDARARVLKRFVRLEYTRHTPGTGLGLSLVRAVAQAHRAELKLLDAAPGLRVEIHFPRLQKATPTV